jgi:predicted NBD/HSP70 family sugar kinase
MYLAIDIGGTKTLLAVFSYDGAVKEQAKFPTPQDYGEFTGELKKTLESLETKQFTAVCVAMPGKVDRENGVGLAFGNLPWRDVPLRSDIGAILSCPAYLENDVKLAALSEARQPEFTKYRKLVYITVSTGISDGLVVDGKIEPNIADSEAGHMMLEHNGQVVTWESFASGKAIYEKYGKKAADITDEATWQEISHNIAIGLIDVIANLQPDVVVIGGGVGTHFAKYGRYLEQELKRYEQPLVTIPPVMQAIHPEEAVIYGCYELLKDHVRAT